MSGGATVPKLWPGSTIVCLGGGPSLTQADVDLCRGRARVIAINDAYKLAPWADVLYACDDKWWEWHKGVKGFAGLKYSMTAKTGKWPNVQRLRNDGPHGLCLTPTGLRTGRNGGYQAINLAVHLGAARILLLGYDMERSGGKSHWFGEHPKGSTPSPYQSFLQVFPTLVEPLKKLSIEVVNCSRRTALKTFPLRPLEAMLPANELAEAV
jgi:hypothetical protein